MKTFLEYLVEENKDKDIHVVVATERIHSTQNGLSHTANRFVEECKIKGLNCDYVFVDEVFFDDKPTEKFKLYNFTDKKSKLELDPTNTVVIVRGSVATSEKGLSFISALEHKGFFVINSRKAFEICDNKFATTQMLKENGIPVPNSALVSDIDSIDEVVKNVSGGKYPIVIKTIRGAEGIGVSIVDSRASLVSVLQTLWKYRAEVLIQEFIPIKFDVRTIVLNGKVIASMRRNKIKGDFRSNASLGAKVQKYELSEKEKNIVLKAAKIVGAYYCGVDHFIENGKIYLVEVNTSPGSEGIEGVTGKNIIGEVVEYVSEIDNWIYPTRESGYVEKIEVIYKGKNVGRFDAKFDTGNGATSAFNADIIEVNKKNETVVFKINGKKYTAEYEREIKFVDKDYDIIDYRYVVLFDLKIKNKVYRDVELALTKRKSEPILINRDVIKKLNLIINVTKKYTFGENKK